MNRRRIGAISGAISGMLITSGATAAEDTVKIPGHAWVHVKNMSPIASGNSLWSFGDTCSVGRPGTVTKVAEDNERGTILVRYSLPSTAYGALCPSGTLFEVSAEDFATMNARADAADAADKSEHARIERLLLEPR